MKINKSRHAMLPVILALALPTMLEQLLQTAVQYIDTAMVGSLGTQATAAVGATTTVNWLIGSSISALGIGFLSHIARSIGAGDTALAKRISAQSVFIVLTVGGFFTLLCLGLSGMVPIWMQVDPAIRDLSAKYFFILYTPMLPRAASIIFSTLLRAAGDTKTPMRVGILVNLTNIVLNFFLIFPTRTLTVWGISFTMPGAGMGVIGAAIASAIAFTVGGICMTAAYWNHPVLSPRGEKLLPEKVLLLPCLRTALPNMLQRFGTSLGYVAFAAMINSLGDVSTAAHTIANTVESAFYIPGFGMQTAAATLAGNAVGAKDSDRMRDLMRVIFPLEVILMTVSGGLLFFLAPSMIRLFAEEMAVILLGTTILRMVSLSEPFYGVSIIIEGMMLGVGKTITPFIFNLIGMWGVRIIGTFIFTQILHFGLVSAWGCMIAHNILLFILFLIHFVRGKWNPLQTGSARI